MNRLFLLVFRRKNAHEIPLFLLQRCFDDVINSKTENQNKQQQRP